MTLRDCTKWRGVRRALPVAVAVALALAVSACSGAAEAGDGAPSGIRPLASPVRAEPDRLLTLVFDGSAAELAEGSRVEDMGGRGNTGFVRLEGSAEYLELVPGERGRGQALQFPDPCEATGRRKASCPKGIVEVDDAAGLSPGVEPFRFGASLSLPADRTSKGSNVVQKGFSVGGGSQWKLQVDGLTGHPSCVLVGKGEEEVHQARADVGVADDRWHTVTCERAGGSLRITVDGQEHGSVPVPDELVVDPPGPVRLGGKHLKPNNDQFFGALDDVFVEALPD